MRQPRDSRGRFTSSETEPIAQPNPEVIEHLEALLAGLIEQRDSLASEIERHEAMIQMIEDEGRAVEIGEKLRLKEASFEEEWWYANYFDLNDLDSIYRHAWGYT